MFDEINLRSQPLCTTGGDQSAAVILGKQNQPTHDTKWQRVKATDFYGIPL